MGYFELFSAATLLAIAILAACREADRGLPSAPLPPRSPPVQPVWDASPVQTDSLVYTLRRSPGEYRAVVSATYTNRTGASVYFERCTSSYTTPMFRISRTGPDSTRKFFVDWGWGCHGNVPPGVILPGASVAIAARFGSGDQPNMRPALQPEWLVGVFRIYLDLCTRPEGAAICTDARPPNERVSNAFEVRY